MPYESCVFYAVVLAVLALDRPTLKDKASAATGQRPLAPPCAPCVSL